MIVLRTYLVVVLVGLLGYTLVVGLNQGWNLFPVFFSNIVEIGWSGQFHLDFATYLGLSGLWVAWRHQFTGAGIALGLVAFVGGMLFFAPYLLWAIANAAGDVKVLLLGRERAHSA